MSELIGPAGANRPEETPASLLHMWQGVRGDGEDRDRNGALCPRMSVVMGCVIDIGEPALNLAGPM